MKVNFRQGMVRRQTLMSAPDFLRKTSFSGTSIDLIVSPEPTVVTFAHLGANYLIEETKSVTAAWGGGSDAGSGVHNDALVPSGQTQYLYWDLDIGTAQVRRGWTLLPLLVTPVPPAAPADDQHWFDTSDISKPIMRVFKKPGASPGKWLDKIRCFVATYTNSATINPFPTGTQVGIIAPPGQTFSSGPILLGVNNKPLRQSDGTFATTETQMIVQQTAGQNIRFDSALTYGQASEEIPKFSCVSVQPSGRLGLTMAASDIRYAVSGIVIEDMHQEEVAQMVSNGVIRNDQWAWTDAQISKPLFCGPSGEITLVRPTVGILQQVGFVYDTSAIYVNLLAPIRLK